eukprot:8391875-Lingulodinium_polyedra.AAC.1
MTALRGVGVPASGEPCFIEWVANVELDDWQGATAGGPPEAVAPGTGGPPVAEDARAMSIRVDASGE